MADKQAIQQSGLPIIWVLGGPGCGKGTQCEQLATVNDYTHLSTGELLRCCVMSGSPRGLQLFGIMEKGQMVPDEEVVTLLAEAIMSKLSSTKGFLIDGFPASVQQAKMFEDQISTPTNIIVLEAHDEVLKGRLRSRGNFDDNDESIKKRIESFTEKTRPVIDAYAKVLKKVSADRKVEEIFADVSKIINAS